MRKPLFVLLTAAILSGCAASGAKLSSVESTFPDINSSEGRVYFYRTYNSFGAGMRPTIFVDSKPVGKSIPGGVFYKDLPKGNHAVTIDAQLYPGQSTLQLNIEPKETTYVKTWIGVSGFGGRTNMAIVGEAEGNSAINDLSFTGSAK